MRHIVASVILCSTVVAVAGCAPSGETSEQMIAAAKALDKQCVEAINKRDVDALMATCWNSPDYVSYPVGTLEARGWQAVKADTVQMFAGMPPSATVEATEANYMVAGDVVIAWGKWRMKIPQAGGEPTVLDGRAISIIAKRDGKWVYILDHTSVPFTPPK